MHLRLFTIALAATLLLAGAARADFQYEFAQGGTVGTSFSVAQGSTIDIQVYLLQTNGPTTNSTNLTAKGLSFGGVALQYSASAPFSIASTSAITPNSAFSTSSPALSTSSGTTTASLQLQNDSPVFAPTTGTNAGAILLGTFTFTGSSVGTSTTVSALPNANGANNVDGAGTNLDSLIANSSASITVTAVPEPGSVVLTGLLALGIAGAARRRLRRAPATA
jgi:hypothetical protein